MSGTILKSLLALTLSLSTFAGSVSVLAEETAENPEDETAAEELASEEIPEEAPEEIPEEPETETEMAELTEGEGLIREIEAPETEDFEAEEKPSLAEAKAMFPSVLRVRVSASDADEGEWLDVPVTWECMEDYEQEDEQFEFYPEFEGYQVSEDAELPLMYLFVGDGLYGPVSEEEDEEELDYELEVLQRDDDLLGASLPSKFDTRAALPAVRNQGKEGACWSFANIGSLEADMIHDGLANSSIDLSELQLAYFTAHTYTDPKNNHKGDTAAYKGKNPSYLSNGGTASMAYRALTNNVGPVNETDVPYSAGYTLVPDMKYAVSSNVAQTVGAYLISPKDTVSIKEAIRDHGAVNASMWARTGNWRSKKTGKLYKVRYNKKNNCFYSQLNDTNHRVMIVGWDDNFPASNFTAGCRPAGNGAWLVRNSWGEQGDSIRGYFWLSYYDKGFLNSANVLAYDVTKTLYNYCYSYDSVPLPNRTYRFSRTAAVTQEYTVDAGEVIRAVGFETGSQNLNVEISVSDGSTVSTAVKKTTHTGFYSVPLSHAINVTEKKKVTLTITYTGSGSVRVVTEGIGSASSRNIRFTAAMSGPGCKINGATYKCDARMRLYTTKGATPTPTVTPEPSPTSDTVNMYRMYNPSNGEHFYTGNMNERTTLVNAGWKYEGVGFKAAKKSSTPMYRLYNPNSGDHHYTSNAKERDSLVSTGWKYEGIGWYADDAKSIPMYRLFNPSATTGSHHYTKSTAERDSLVASGWKNEGIGFYACR